MWVFLTGLGQIPYSKFTEKKLGLKARCRKRRHFAAVHAVVCKAENISHFNMIFLRKFNWKVGERWWVKCPSVETERESRQREQELSVKAITAVQPDKRWNQV